MSGLIARCDKYSNLSNWIYARKYTVGVNIGIEAHKCLYRCTDNFVSHETQCYYDINLINYIHVHVCTSGDNYILWERALLMAVGWAMLRHLHWEKLHFQKWPSLTTSAIKPVIEWHSLKRVKWHPVEMFSSMYTIVWMKS